MKKKANLKAVSAKTNTRPTIQKEKKKTPFDIKIFFFLFVLVFILYGNTIPNKYSLDDEFVTFNNPVIQKGIKAIPEIFTTHYVNNAQQSYDYRPVVKLSYALEYALFKGNPHVSHFINVLLYFLLCVFLYFILKMLLHKYHSWLPVVICILFAAHPVHTEVVASLKNRDELLSMLGALATWYLIIKFTDTGKWYLLVVALFFFFLAYYSKSNVIVYIALIPLSLYFFKDVKLSKILFIASVLLLTAAVFNILPRIILSPSKREILYFENPLYFEKGFWLRIGTALIAILFYLRLLVFPHPLLFYYGYDMIPVAGPGNIWAVASLVICVFLLAVALFLFKRKHVLSFGILFFFIAISVFSNIIKPPPGIVAERFLLSASLGFVMVLSVLFFMIFRLDFNHKTSFSYNAIKFPFILFLIVLISYSIRTIVRNNDWKDYKTLYSHDIVCLEKSAKANAVYASLLNNELYRVKEPIKQKKIAQEAQKYYERALKIYPRYVIAWNNLGIIYFRYQQKPRKAIHCWKNAFSYDSSYAEPVLNTAAAFDEMNMPDSAEIYYLKSIKINSKFSSAYSKLGDFYFRHGKPDKAIDVNKKMMEFDSISDVPYINIGNFYLLSKDTINAIAMFEKAIEKQPANPKLCKNLAGYFEHIGNVVKADHYYKLSKNQ